MKSKFGQMRIPPWPSDPAVSGDSQDLNPVANGLFAHRRRSLAAGFGPDVRSLGLAQQQAAYDEGQARDNHRVVESGIDIAGGGDGGQANQRRDPNWTQRKPRSTIALRSRKAGD
jgi:hypothetical protein